MDETYTKKLTDWVLTLGQAPDEKEKICGQNESLATGFLPCGRFVTEVPTDLRDIISLWISENVLLHEKSIYLNDHYAFVAKRFESENNVEFIGTYRE